jgi:hypothetical protein
LTGRNSATSKQLGARSLTIKRALFLFGVPKKASVAPRSVCYQDAQTEPLNGGPFAMMFTSVRSALEGVVRAWTRLAVEAATALREEDQRIY